MDSLETTPDKKPPMSSDLVDTICDRIAAGESLRQICRDPQMPEITSVMRFRRNNSDFAQQYTRAREMQAEVFGDELKEIADDGSNDWMEKHFGQSTAWVINGEAVARSRLRFDARRWWMSKVLPQRYGDKLDLNHSGSVSLADRISKIRARKNAD